IFLQMMAALAPYETVNLLVDDAVTKSRRGDATRRACDNRVGPESVSSSLAGSGFDEAVGERTVEIDPPIAQEGPVLPRLVNLVRVAIDDQDFFFIAGSFRNDPPERIGHE